ncbi:histidine phosphatase family protein [Clostridium tyrobutyricum]|uniref:histidine phosphatase family protein n=1 Tax=Clostridium tyrobutyricum TaxID=1519 RepID=UPI00300253CF
MNWKTTGIGKTMCNRNLNLKIACKRAKTAILSLIKIHEHERIVVVAHKGIIKAGLMGLLEWNLNMYNKIILLNTSICQLSFNESLTPSIFTLNDDSHLKWS